MTSTEPVDLLVALPAHDEAELITECLTSVLVAVRTAQRDGVVRQARVAVAAHRCTDATAACAHAVIADLADQAGVDGFVLVEDAVLPVGTVRTRLIEAATATSAPPAGPAGHRPPAARTWVFNTDADTRVPPDWISATLARADERQAQLVLGLADLDDWAVDAATRDAYERIISQGLGVGGHQHAYAANLAVRLDAFRQVGGFPGLPHGEEHGLAAACRAAGLTVISTLDPRVQTSARMPGRATNGLGALLARLAARAEVSAEMV